MSSPELNAGLRKVKNVIISNNIARSLIDRGLIQPNNAAQAAKFGICYVAENPDGISCLLFIPIEAANQATKCHPLGHAAAGLIRHQAGRATYYATVASKISKGTLQGQTSALERVKRSITHIFCSNYFGGRLSGIVLISDEEFSASDSLYCQTLSSCFQGLTNARLQLIQQHDIDAALLQALANVEQILSATASISATAGRDISRWKTSKSFQLLQTVGLGDWFDLLVVDLERLFDSRDSNAVAAEVLFLGSHVERVLISFGILLSTPKDSEQIRMTALADEQFEAIRVVLHT